jgi:hypothetical protein
VIYRRIKTSGPRSCTSFLLHVSDCLMQLFTLLISDRIIRHQNMVSVRKEGWLDQTYSAFNCRVGASPPHASPLARAVDARPTLELPYGVYAVYCCQRKVVAASYVRARIPALVPPSRIYRDLTRAGVMTCIRRVKRDDGLTLDKTGFCGRLFLVLFPQ